MAAARGEGSQRRDGGYRRAGLSRMTYRFEGVYRADVYTPELLLAGTPGNSLSLSLSRFGRVLGQVARQTYLSSDEQIDRFKPVKVFSSDDFIMTTCITVAWNGNGGTNKAVHCTFSFFFLLSRTKIDEQRPDEHVAIYTRLAPPSDHASV